MGAIKGANTMTLIAQNSAKPTINEQIKEKADKINQDLENRYDGGIDESELKDKIDAFESKKTIQGFEQTGELKRDGTADSPASSLLNKILGSGSQVGLTSSASSESPFWSPLIPYSPAIAWTGLAGFLWWLYKAGVYEKLAQNLWGEDGLYYTILEKLGKAKPKVSESSLFLYEKAFKDVRKIARSIITLDNDRFGQEEFLLFAKLQLSFKSGEGDYQGLEYFRQLFVLALAAQRSYISLHQIEMSCQGTKQQTYYDYVHQSLVKGLDPEIFLLDSSQKLAELLPQVKTIAGQERLEAYAHEVERLVNSGEAVDIFHKLDRNNSTGFQALRHITDLIARLDDHSIHDLVLLTRQVMASYDHFEVLGDIIELPEAQRSPDVYARILQSVTLENHYEGAFEQFQRLLQLLKDWYKPFRVLVAIREEHPAEQYRQPQAFEREIPGLTLFQKYKKSLTDEKTGHSYISFEEFTETNRTDPSTRIQNVITLDVIN